MMRRLIFGILLVFFTTNISIAQTIYDTWQRSQSRWQMDMGISVGAATGLQFQYSVPRRNTCKVLNKKMGFDFGVYYEGLIFGNDLKTKEDGWQAGGYRGNLSFVVFPDFRIEANRFFIGAGVESGTRKIYGNQLFQTDFIAKLGWEFCFMPINGAPIVIRTTLKYDKSFNSDFTYLLPSIGLIWGK